MPRWWSAVLVAAALLAAASAGPASACSCAERSAATKVEESDVVFVGKVIRLEVVGSVDPTIDLIEATLEVLDVVKGDLQGSVVVRTSNGCCYCAMGFGISNKYLVYARFGGSNMGIADENQLGTSSCSSGTLRERQDDLKELGLLHRVFRDYRPDGVDRNDH